MKFNMKFNTKNLLENKFVLYLVFFLALVSVFSYIVSNNYAPVLLFLLIAILTYYFSKNMIIILGAAIVGTHLVSLINGTNIFNGGNREGFVEGATTDDKSGDDKSADDTDSGSNDATKKPTHDGKPAARVMGYDPHGMPVKKKATADDKSANNTNTGADVTTDGSTTTGAGETTKGTSKKSGFTNQSLTPAALNLPNVDNLAAKDDKAKRTERAYDLLESGLGGGDGDTKDLLNKQVQLMDQMKQITPILQQTMGLVNNIDLGSLTDMADKISKMIPEDLGSISDLANKASASAKN